MVVIKHLAFCTGGWQKGEGPAGCRAPSVSRNPKNEFYHRLFERGRFYKYLGVCFFERGRFDKDLGISKKCFVRRQLFWGPICEWFSPFWATFKLFSKKVVRNIQQNGADLKSSVLIQDLATKKVAVPQTGFLKEDDLTKTLGFQKSALWDGNFFGGRFVSAFRHSGEL